MWLNPKNSNPESIFIKLIYHLMQHTTDVLKPPALSTLFSSVRPLPPTICQLKPQWHTL